MIDAKKDFHELHGVPGAEAAGSPTDFTAERLARRLHDLVIEAFAVHPPTPADVSLPWDEQLPVVRNRYLHVARGLLYRGLDAVQERVKSLEEVAREAAIREGAPELPYHGERPEGAGFEDDRGGYDDLDPADRPRF